MKRRMQDVDAHADQPHPAFGIRHSAFRIPRLVTLGAPAILLLLLAAVVLRTAWVSDDAFITFRTVDHALNGHGLRWNVAERVQSYTHPLWMLLLLPTVAIVGSPYLASLLLSFALTAVTVAFLLASARGRPWAGAFGLAALVFSKAFVDYSTSGLENPLSHALLAAVMLTTATSGRGQGPGARGQDGMPATGCERPNALLSDERRALLLGLLVALIGLSRMDLLLIAGPIALAALLPPGGPLVPVFRTRHPASGIRHSAFRLRRRLRRDSPKRRAKAVRIPRPRPVSPWPPGPSSRSPTTASPSPTPRTPSSRRACRRRCSRSRAFRYLAESLDRDPLTLPVVAAAIVAPIVLLVMRIGGGRTEVRPYWECARRGCHP
jgi:hypothetical protein